MNKNSNTTLLFSCFIFSIIVTVVLFVFTYFLNIDYSLSLSLLTLFVAFASSFLFFYFVYQKLIYNRIEQTILKLKQFHSKRESDEAHDYTFDFADPIEELNQEIIRIANDRQKEVEQLTKLENYRKEYLGNVSHELKTPIFNIQGYISTLIDGGIHDKNINVEYLKRADKSVDRMIHIIDDLETISQLESGSLFIEYEKFDLNILCKEVIEQLELISSKRGISLKFETDYSKPLKVLADKYRIRQVLVNLITNSIKYGKEKGLTIISFKVIEDKVHVSISDNGIGVKEEHLERLFERFYRVDKGRSREQGGTGLGLSIVKHILEAHEQQITVSSIEGEGTTFTFTLMKT